MQTVGIICEYNPFHNGHLYHIEKIKEMFPNSLIVLVLSGDFTQRGDISILNKWDKTNISLNHRIDLIIELPFAFATQSADIFAKGSIEILNYLKTDYLVFGSESNDINTLTTLAQEQLNSDYQNQVKQNLSKGINYPTALANAFNNNSVSTPNDILGLSYIREIIKQNSNIKPLSIKRTNNYNDDSLNNNIVSAKAIRENLTKDIKGFLPQDSYESMIKDDLDKNIFAYLKYKIISEGLSINKYQTVDEGLENRILKYIDTTNSLEELILKVKTKRYTYNKLKRMFTHILCSFTKEEAINNKEIKYLRILGFNHQGQLYLNKLKKEINIPIITSSIKKYESLLDIDLRSTKIYNLITNNNRNIYQEKSIIK